MIAPILFVVSFIIQGIFKQGYNSLRHPISSLSLGENGWIQDLTFIITGTLIVLFSVGIKLTSKDRPLFYLMTLVGIGIFASGIFTTDALFGYPTDHSNLSKEFTIHGMLHSISALLVFIGLPILCFRMSNHFISKNKKIWKYYSIATGITMLFLFLLTSFALGNFLNLKSLAGLIQRLCILTGFLWISLWANYLISRPI